MSDVTFSSWFETHCNDIDALVFDVDGVLMIGKTPADGAADILRHLRERQFPFSLLTNDAHHSVSQKVERLRRRGMDVFEEEIVSSGHGLKELAIDRELVGELFYVMGDLGDPCYAELAGMRTTRDTSDLPLCRGVIVGECNFEWEPAINAAINFFLDCPDGLLIVPNPDEFFMTDPVHVAMASGAPAHLVAHILALFGQVLEPIRLGKPNGPIFAHNHSVLAERFNIPVLRRDRVLMLGDSLKSDVAGAKTFGYRAALVMTGITTPQRLSEAKIQPDFVFERL